MSREKLDRLIIKLSEGSDGANWDKYTAIIRQLNKDSRLLSQVIGPEGMREWELQPHLRYMILRQQPIVHKQIRDDSFMRLRQHDVDVSPYSRCPISSMCLFSTVHQGQRKLLISEIKFLLLHGDKARNVVYIGAACGKHIPILAELFPTHKFLLYDPATFSKEVKSYTRDHPDRMAFYNELFPPEDLSRVQPMIDEGFLLISDIRRRDQESDSPTNADVLADIQVQNAICRSMKPRAAHLKIRLPYFDPETERDKPDIPVRLPKGVFYFQPWVGHKSSETRLVAEPPYTDENSMEISSKWYESALHHHNLNDRYFSYSSAQLTMFEPFFSSIYDSCFDCTFEKWTFMEYLTSGRKSEAYGNFSVIYELIKKYLGREDERMLR